MIKKVDRAIVLGRVNYAEKDKVLSVLCRNDGKISLFAKGVRAQKSKLSAGSELLNINEITYIIGKSNLCTLVSARIVVINEEIVKNYKKTELIFKNLKLLSKKIEDNEGQEYFGMLENYLVAMNDDSYDYRIVEVWVRLRLLNIFGVVSEFVVDSNSHDDLYSFDYEKQMFTSNKATGRFTKNDIKVIRLCSQSVSPIKLNQPINSEDFLLDFSEKLLMHNLD